jgi:hypothetical protein
VRAHIPAAMLHGRILIAVAVAVGQAEAKSCSEAASAAAGILGAGTDMTLLAAPAAVAAADTAAKQAVVG